MRKGICAFALAALVCVAVCADGLFTVSIDTVRDALWMRTFSGDYAVKEPDFSQTVFNYQGEGETKSFQTTAFGDTFTALVKFAYADEQYGGLLQLKMINGVNNIFGSDWEAWLRLGSHARLLGGNQAQRGKIAQYQNFDDFLTLKIDNLGIMIPDWQRTPQYVSGGTGNNLNEADFPYGYGQPNTERGFSKFAGSETGDLFIPAGSTGRLSGFLADCVFDPVTITASVGGLFEQANLPLDTPWAELWSPTLPSYDKTREPVVKTGIGFGVRAEATEIAGILTAAAMYKYAASTVTKLEALDDKNLVDELVNNHAFGVYANIRPIAGLGITLGYSGQVRFWKNTEYQNTNPTGESIIEHWPSKYGKTVYPFYNGIDLRAQYSGVEKLTVTFNNNVSFSRLGGTVDRTEIFINSWAYASQLNENVEDNGAAGRSENYLGYYAALGAAYNPSDVLTLYAQVANQLGVFTLRWEEDPLTSITDNLGAYIGVKYQFIKKFGFRSSVRGGLALKLHSYSYQETISADRLVLKAGYCEFGIPIAIKVEF
jgi:hypothetical protein